MAKIVVDLNQSEINSEINIKDIMKSKNKLAHLISHLNEISRFLKKEYKIPQKTIDKYESK